MVCGGGGWLLVNIPENEEEKKKKKSERRAVINYSIRGSSGPFRVLQSMCEGEIG